MLNRKFVRDCVMTARVDLSATRVDELIDDAARLLGNLVHYRHGGAHEDEDIVMTVLAIGQNPTTDGGKCTCGAYISGASDSESHSKTCPFRQARLRLQGK